MEQEQELALLMHFFVDSTAPGRGGSNFKCIIFKVMIANSVLAPHCEIALSWMT